MSFESRVRCRHTWQSGRQCERMASWTLDQRSRHSGRPVSSFPVCDDSKHYLTRAFQRRNETVRTYFRQYFEGIDRLTFTPLAGGAPEVVEG